MDFTEWSKLAFICILGAMSPGPSLVVILKMSINRGRTQGVLSGIGHGLGITLYALIAVIGLATFFNNSPFFFTITQIIGSLFLIWIGTRMIVSFLSHKHQTIKELKDKKYQNQGFIEGFLIAFLNPKIAAWTFALFSQFVKPNATLYDQILLISTVGSIDTLWYCFVATIATSKIVIRKIDIYGKKIDLIMGIVLIILAFSMILDVNSKI